LSLNGPKDLQSAPNVSDRALELASDFAHIELTKFRFRIGCAFIVLAIFVFFLGHSIFVDQYFTTDFTARSWTITELLLVLGAAFAGKEVVESLVTAFKSIKS
jgi:hypothetical protein